jgi:Ser/Thr protein kinase RdoA (MazF antagonist)
MTTAETEAVYAAAAAEALADFPVTVGSIELIQVSENITWRVTDDAGCRYVLRLHRPGYHELDEPDTNIPEMDIVGLFPVEINYEEIVG